MANKKKIESRRSVGRPTDYKPEYCEMLIKHMAEGLSFECFAALVDTSRETLYNWTEKHPEFLYAKKRGLEKCQLFWEKLGKVLVSDDVVRLQNDFGVKPFLKKHTTKTFKDGTTEEVDEYHVPKCDTGAWIFNMKNRFGWRDIQDIIHGVDERIGKIKIEIVKK